MRNPMIRTAKDQTATASPSLSKSEHAMRIAAAKYIASVKEPGIYDMDDLLGDI